MTTKTLRYTLENFNSILFNGFDYKLPDETLETISNLSLQVGSPDYVRTPVFKKRENPMKFEPSILKETFKKGKRGKSLEIINEDDWEAIRTFQTTKIDEKNGIDAQIDMVRIFLNKLTDKNYMDMRNKIMEIIDKLCQEKMNTEDMSHFSTAIFDIASTNRFYSKIYAELYADLSSKYSIFKSTFEYNFNQFIDLFNNIEYVDSKVDYDKFCVINKIN